MTSDIGDSNQRQSDFYWGWEDARDGKEPRSDSPDYIRGYAAGTDARKARRHK